MSQFMKFEYSSDGSDESAHLCIPARAATAHTHSEDS